MLLSLCAGDLGDLVKAAAGLLKNSAGICNDHGNFFVQADELFVEGLDFLDLLEQIDAGDSIDALSNILDCRFHLLDPQSGGGELLSVGSSTKAELSDGKRQAKGEMGEAVLQLGDGVHRQKKN